MNREKRQGIDLVNDDVEKSLIKEVEVIKKCQMKMKKVLDKAYVQLKYVTCESQLFSISFVDTTILIS